MGGANKGVRLVRALPSDRRDSSVISNNAFSESNHAEFDSLPSFAVQEERHVLIKCGIQKVGCYPQPQRGSRGGRPRQNTRAEVRRQSMGC